MSADPTDVPEETNPRAALSQIALAANNDAQTSVQDQVQHTIQRPQQIHSSISSRSTVKSISGKVRSSKDNFRVYEEEGRGEGGGEGRTEDEDNLPAQQSSWNAFAPHTHQIKENTGISLCTQLKR
jgi:hypothetical protein